MIARIKRTHLLIAIAAVCILGSCIYFFGGRYVAAFSGSRSATTTADVYVAFDMETYDKIVTNYWMKPSDMDMPELFRLSLAKVENAASTTLPSHDRAGVQAMLSTAFAQASSTDAKQQLALNVAMVVMYNLPPAGRNNVLSDHQEQALRQEVSNVDPTKDLYADLGADKTASKQQLDQAYQQKAAVLKNATSSDAQAQLQKIAYAHQVLTTQDSRAMYDQSLVEPTVFSQVVGKTLYLHITKMAPTTLQEFGRTVHQASTTPGLDSMIIDLRGNIGGALDFFPSFYGLFAGQNQYAFDLFHQGDYQAQRTTLQKFDELNRFHDIAVFTDNMTQSTAEVTTAAFKRFHLGHVVGTATRGWGTVENTYPMDTQIDPNTKYALLIVNSLTLRDDNQPIEGRGVDPDININSKNWRGQLPNVFSSQSLINAVSKMATAQPLM